MHPNRSAFMNSSGALGTARPTLRSAYTLTEVIVAAGLLSLVILGFLGAHLASLEFTEFVRPKVQNTQYARQLLGPLIEEIRCANVVQIGTGTITSFTAAGVGKPQAGNAIRICPTTNLNSYIYYVADSTNQVFLKVPLDNSNAVITVATGITNKTPFVMETFGGTLLTNSQNNCVLSVLLQLHRDSSVNRISDNYQLRTKITRRNIL